MTVSAASEPLAVSQCSAWARAEQLDPGGTAAAFEVLVLVERPLPWPPDIAEAPDLAAVASAVATAAGTRSWRMQAVVPVGDEVRPDRRRILCYRRTGDHFTGFVGVEVDVAPPDIAEAAADLVVGDGGIADRGARSIRVRDVLVCGHGARDRCCGSLGTRLALSASDLGERVRLWRTSHTGGHRFAPTAMVLPSGDVWGYLDEATLRTIVAEESSPQELLHLHRGSAGMPTPGLQLLDRYALGVEGWSWHGQPRRGVEEPLGDGGARVRLEDAEGRVRYEGLVGIRRTLALPVCGGRPGEVGKPVDELELLAAAHGGAVARPTDRRTA